MTSFIRFTDHSPLLSVRHTFQGYKSADWDSLLDHLESYLWNEWSFNSDIFTSVPSFTDILVQGMNYFIPHFSKPGKLESSEWLYRTHYRTISLRCSEGHHRLLPPPPPFGSSNIPKGKAYLFRCKPWSIVLSAIGSRTLWFLSKASSRKFCSYNSSPVCDSTDNVTCETWSNPGLSEFLPCVNLLHFRFIQLSLFPFFYPVLALGISVVHWVSWTFAGHPIWTIYQPSPLKSALELAILLRQLFSLFV